MVDINPEFFMKYGEKTFLLSALPRMIQYLQFLFRLNPESFRSKKWQYRASNKFIYNQLMNSIQWCMFGLFEQSHKNTGIKITQRQGIFGKNWGKLSEANYK